MVTTVQMGCFSSPARVLFPVSVDKQSLQVGDVKISVKQGLGLPDTHSQGAGKTMRLKTDGELGRLQDFMQGSSIMDALRYMGR